MLTLWFSDIGSQFYRLRQHRQQHPVQRALREDYARPRLAHFCAARGANILLDHALPPHLSPRQRPFRLLHPPGIPRRARQLPGHHTVRRPYRLHLLRDCFENGSATVSVAGLSTVPVRFGRACPAGRRQHPQVGTPAPHFQDTLLEGPACVELDRAALSVSNNVAEGFERGTASADDSGRANPGCTGEAAFHPNRPNGLRTAFSPTPIQRAVSRCATPLDLSRCASRCRVPVRRVRARGSPLLCPSAASPLCSNRC